MLVGLLPPTSGDALVFGKNIITDMVVFLHKLFFMIFILCLHVFAQKGKEKKSAYMSSLVYWQFVSKF